MKKLFLILTFVLFSFGASALDKEECSKLEKKIYKFLQNEQRDNNRWLKAYEVIKKKSTRTDSDVMLLDTYQKSADRSLDLAYKYSTIHNAFCKK